MKSNILFIIAFIVLAVGIVYSFLSKESKINKSIVNKKTEVLELLKAVNTGDTNNVQILLKNFKYPKDTAIAFKEIKKANIESSYWTALGVACKNGNIKMVKFLQKNGFDLHDGYYDQWFGYPSIFPAVESGNLELVKYLISQKIDLNVGASENGYTPLIDAIQYQNLSMVKFLLENGASPNKDDSAFPDVEPWIPLKLSLELKNDSISALLISHGAKLKDSHEGEICFDFVSDCEKLNCSDYIKSFVINRKN